MKRILLLTVFGVSLLVAGSVRADNDLFGFLRHRVVGAVFTMDNSPDGNNVWAFGRKADGTLTEPAVYPTQGTGTGGGLGNQGAVQLSDDGRWLFVCNAGSDDISVFLVTPRGLYLTDKASSEGQQPISIALSGPLVYVLNAGGAVSGADSITGFVFFRGRLWHLPGASYSLSDDNTGPADIAFTKDGQNIVVTEKGTGLIDTFQVGRYGLVEGFQSYLSPVPTPFGFATGRHDRIYVTEANGGAANPGGSSVSSYQVAADGGLSIISESVPTFQTAACWLALSHDERFAYTANTPDDSISSFYVHRNGSLELLQSQAGLTGTGSGPVDMSFSNNGRFLYSLNAGNGTIGAFLVNRRTGALTALAGASDLPATVNGLAAR